MKRYAAFTVFVIITFFSVVGVGTAQEFSWMADLNVKAEADISGFKANLAARFGMDTVRVEAVLQAVEKPADAYLVLKLGEMSNRPPEYVLTQYKSHKKEGWGSLARSLGIKPGSAEFHALKKGHDLYGRAPDKGKGRGKRDK